MQRLSQHVAFLITEATMDIKFLFAWATEQGIKVPQKSDGSANINELFAMYDQWKKKNGKGKTDSSDNKAADKKQSVEKDKPEVVELDDNSELAKLIASSDRNKYDTIRRYLIENFGGRELELSDGKKAVIDKSDAKELAHKADSKRTAEIAELENLIKKAKFLTEKPVEHNKFSAFRYYTTPIKYKGEKTEIILNVGIHSYDKKLHLYAITNRPLKQ